MTPVQPDEAPDSETIKRYYQAPVASTYDGDRFSGIAGRVLNRLEKATLIRLLEEAGILPGRSLVLDAPCGTGRATEWLLELGFTVVGADISTPMIDVARARCARFGDRVSFVEQDLETLTLPSNSFELVTCVRLFHHLVSGQRARILSELCRVSRNGVLVNLSFSSPFYRGRRTVKRILRQSISRCSSTEAEIRHEAASAGLRVERRKFVARYVSEDLFVLMRKVSPAG
jgi:ubiquinone/menaquinone biosynthesis C-methylase UbiE